MIILTKLNDQSFTLNALYIEQVQAFPDTTVTLTNGKKIVVKETEQELYQKITEFYKQIGLTSLVSKHYDSNEEV
ncbi:hypothetical protein CR203_02890 [Salipaludibacillus neizhouensis]|uniref:Flagellar protein FlbD n=1 Tax=Salipaludibacillus neizhouensis TaxID=885475 RepID=A0A3A9KEP5_9BACI|nr:flagellar FlbD family protein [Salipaludibacillus neizhouensis]RKL69001.1 hypothetical protein CR203_02890 [Salipaludibacillus neizhouensis]